MRTLILSDLHLGNGGDYDVFAGGEALPALLDLIAREPARGPGQRRRHRLPHERRSAGARSGARRRAGPRHRRRARESAAVLRALGRVLARGGEVMIRLGNHDVELAAPGGAGGPARGARAAAERSPRASPSSWATRPRSSTWAAPAILVTHGEHSDNWNKVDYGRLARLEGYRYAAGSVAREADHEPRSRAGTASAS